MNGEIYTIMEDVLISVIIPVYNGEKYISKALDTVMNQSVLPYEIVIVNDGSTDGTSMAIEDYLKNRNIPINFLKVINQKNLGAGEARNTGLCMATGNWVSFLDCDDEWSTKKIELVVNTIKRNPDFNIIAHNEFWKYVDNNALSHIAYLKEKYNPDKDFFVQMYEGNLLSTSSLTIKKLLLDQTNLFDTTLQPAEDYDLWMRLSKRGKLFYMDDVLTTYLIRRDSISSSIMNRYNAEIEICLRNYSELKRRLGQYKAFKVLVLRIFKIHIIETYLAYKGRQYSVMAKVLCKYIPNMIYVMTNMQRRG